VGDILQKCIPSTQSSEAPVLYTGLVYSLSSGIQPVTGSSNTAMGIDSYYILGIACSAITTPS